MEIKLAAPGPTALYIFHLIRMEKDQVDANEMQRFSEVMFGAKHRLSFAVTVLRLARKEPHNLYKQQLARELGVHDPEIEKHLADFTALKLIESHPDPPDPPERRGRGKPPEIMRPVDDDFWTCLQSLGERFRHTSLEAN